MIRSSLHIAVLTLALPFVFTQSALAQSAVLESAWRQASRVELTRSVQSTQVQVQRRETEGEGGAKLRWTGVAMIGVGATMVMMAEQQCHGLRMQDYCFGERSWPAGIMTAGVGVAATGAVLALLSR